MNPGKIETAASKSWPFDRLVLVVVSAGIILIYGWMARKAEWPDGVIGRTENYYALLADAFRIGQLNLAKDVPPGFARLANPYDPVANAPYRGWRGLHDMSYYRGKLYLYFGVVPAVGLFWPYAALAGGALAQERAVAIFCAAGFGVSAWLFCAIRRRYFPEVGTVVVVAGVAALGLGSGQLLMLMTPGVYEAAIACAYALVMATLAALWLARENPGREAAWLSIASLCYGLAVGARPSVFFGAIILLVPVIWTWRIRTASRRELGVMLAAAVIPITLVGLGLMLYNYLRFDDPAQFGQGFQLTGNNQHEGHRLFSSGFLWFNVRVYFLEPMRWSAHFPFALGTRLPALPANYLGVENPFGVLLTVPLVWFGLAVPLAWRHRGGGTGGALRELALEVAGVFAVSAFTLCLFGGACSRYEAEFIPALMLLAVLGMLELESALAGRPRWRAWARGAWSMALVFSIAFNAIIGFGPMGPFPSLQNNIGYGLLDANRLPEAIARFRLAVRCSPDFAEAHCNLGFALFQSGDMAGAITHFSEAVRISANFPEAENNLGIALFKTGRLAEAKTRFERALQLRSDFADARVNLRQVEIALQPAVTTGGKSEGASRP